MPVSKEAIGGGTSKQKTTPEPTKTPAKTPSKTTSKTQTYQYYSPSSASFGLRGGNSATWLPPQVNYPYSGFTVLPYHTWAGGRLMGELPMMGEMTQLPEENVESDKPGYMFDCGQFARDYYLRSPGFDVLVNPEEEVPPEQPPPVYYGWGGGGWGGGGWGGYSTPEPKRNPWISGLANWRIRI